MSRPPTRAERRLVAQEARSTRAHEKGRPLKEPLTPLSDEQIARKTHEASTKASARLLELLEKHHPKK